MAKGLVDGAVFIVIVYYFFINWEHFHDHWIDKKM